jgi:hypothetical protein
MDVRRLWFDNKFVDIKDLKISDAPFLMKAACQGDKKTPNSKLRTPNLREILCHI